MKWTDPHKLNGTYKGKHSMFSTFNALYVVQKYSTKSYSIYKEIIRLIEEIKIFNFSYYTLFTKICLTMGASPSRLYNLI